MAKKIRKPRFVIIDGCPCPYDVAPYVYLVLRQAGQTASSIYRGEDAKALLHRYGKHTQSEIHKLYPTISNPEGESQHDLHSDGVGNRGPVGRKLETWEVGIDSGTNSERDKSRIEAAAAHLGLVAKHPYSRGVEQHHWCFAKKPKADGKHLTRTRVIITRARLLKATRY